VSQLSAGKLWHTPALYTGAVHSAKLCLHGQETGQKYQVAIHSSAAVADKLLAACLLSGYSLLHHQGGVCVARLNVSLWHLCWYAGRFVCPGPPGQAVHQL
jgi:hypothetical protein